MTPADYDTFCEIVLAFAELRGKQLSAPAIELYWRAMQHWSIQDFRQAANTLLSTSEFMPTPFHFERLRKSTCIGKHEAWEQALRRCTQHIEHPLDRITRAAQMVGGYYVIGHTNNDSLPFLAKRFMDAYEEIGTAEVAREALPNHVPQIVRLLRSN